MDNIFKKTNRIMINVLWFGAVAETLYIWLVATMDLHLKLILMALLFPLAIGASVMHRANFHADKIKYLMVVAFAVLNFAFVYLFTDLNGIITAYLFILIIGLYQDYRLVVVEGLACGGFIFLGYNLPNAEKMFGSFNDVTGLINIYFTLGLFIFFVSTLCVTSRGLRRDVELEREEAETSKARLEDVFRIITESVVDLTGSSDTLDEHIQGTQSTTQEITQVFRTVSDQTRDQKEVLNQVSQEIIDKSQDVDRVSDSTIQMSNLSSENLSQIQEAEMNLQALHKNMVEVGENTQVAVDSSNALKELTDNISSVLESVNSISEQINLLALNASIEAARAGDHGRGFAVVAQEVGKLAEESKNSTIEISELLNQIKEQTDSVSGQMTKIMTYVEAGGSQTRDMSTAFKQVSLNSRAVSDKSSSVKTMTQDINEFFKTYQEKMDQVVESFAYMNQVIQGLDERVETQNNKVEAIVGSNDDVKRIVETLNATV